MPREQTRSESRGRAGARTPATGAFLAWVTGLVHANRAKLVRVARREGLSGEDALDCAQETFFSFLSLPQARLLVEAPEDAAKVLTVLARNLARNRRRRHDRARPHDEAAVETLRDDDATADELVERAEEHARVVGCVATLGEMQRAVVSLRLVDELSGEDVARSLGTTPGNVAVLLHRAKTKLRACMDA